MRFTPRPATIAGLLRSQFIFTMSSPITSPTQNSRSVVRNHYRQLRQALTTEAQVHAAQQCLTICQKEKVFDSIHTVACYLANDGELDPSYIIEYCWQQQIQVLLPILDPVRAGYLCFMPYERNTPMIVNKYGIAEPEYQAKKVVAVADIELIFTPLVAFDANGNRMGMGGGYYDRTLADLKNSSNTRLVGLAHNCQQAESLPVSSWDVPISAIATDRQWLEAPF